MGSCSPLWIGWTFRPPYIPLGGSIASTLEGEMAAFHQSGGFVSPGYAYDHRGGRALVSLYLQGTSNHYEVELYPQIRGAILPQEPILGSSDRENPNYETQ